jgi:long-subunit fatty acid transport protein
MKPAKKKIFYAPSLTFAAVLAVFTVGHAGGIYDNGFGARSMAMGGADVAYAADPLGAMGANPAGLGFLTEPQLSIGAIGGFLQGHFEKPGVSSGNLD